MVEERAPGRYLVPYKLEVDGSNGHFAWYCRVEEVDEHGNVMQGPVQLHGTHTSILNDEHEGEHEHFLLNKVKPQMLKHYDDWKTDHEKGKQLVGKSL